MAGRERGRVLWGVGGVAALTALLGCGGCGTSPLAATPGSLEGRWTWVRSTGGIDGGVRTPATQGHGWELNIDGNRLTLHRPGWLELVTPVAYTVGVGAPGTPLEGEPVIRYALPIFGFDEQAIEVLEEDRLVLRDPCCDGFTWEWVRSGPAEPLPDLRVPLR